MQVKIRPTIALCIPAYNASKFLPTILTSAKKQLIPFDEIIIYDDCSEDNTSEIAENFGAKVIRGKVNVGCSVGKNILAENTQSDWIHFHDADDDLYDNFTEVAHSRIMTDNAPDVILFDYEYRDYNTKKLISIRKFDAKMLEVNPIKYSIREQINPFCGLYKKEKFLAAGGYDTDPNVLYNEDVAMHFKIASYGLTFSAVNIITIVNNRVPNSMSVGNRVKCSYAQFEVLKKMNNFCGALYYITISTKIWDYARLAAFYKEWGLLKNMIKLAIQLNGKKSINDSRFFNILLRINPYLAFYLREYLNVFFRKNYTKKEWW